MTTDVLHRLSDRELLEVTAHAAADERRATVELVELLAEVDARRLYLGQGCSSLFTYCTQVLRLSESAAYRRIEAARVIRVFPLIGEQLRNGSMTLTTVALLRPHLTLKNHVQLLGDARGKSKREVEQQVARLAPQPEVAALVRRLPDRTVPVRVALVTSALMMSALPQGTGETPPPAKPAFQPRVEPLASDRYLLRVSLSAAGHENLRRAQGLMRHSLPSGDLTAVVERALELLVEHLERRKFAGTAQARRPRRSPAKPSSVSGDKAAASKTSPLSTGKAAASRHLPASVRRAVWKRDKGRCAFIGPNGRCTETGRLEFHHIVPFARGGSAGPGNIALRCRAHNAYEGELCFGRRDVGERSPRIRPGSAMT